MNGMAIMIVAIVAVIAGYAFYGKFLEKTWGIDDKRPTPAVALKDGQDYMPTKRQVVFGHQFASIAGAGPINGPIQAAVFGWVPVLLWCLIGGIFIGAVQDYSAMYASVHNKGKSIGFIIEKYVGKTGKRLFLLFCYLFSILVVAAFADICAKSFGTSAGFTAAVNHSNGQVATTSVLFIAAAVFLGLLFKKLPNLSTAKNTVISLVLLVACIALGYVLPMNVSVESWRNLVFFYILIASVAPVWILLQPRDYLNSYLLVIMILAAVLGILVARPVMNLPAFTGFTASTGSLFPILFVTVACGAVSGFHSLVSSETASKQVAKESDMLPVSYGAMLLEVVLGVISLVAAGSVASASGALPKGTPQVIFAGAVAGFLQKIGLPNDLSFELISLAVSAFALTSLDSVARVGRLSWQELFTDSDHPEKGPVATVLSNKWVATILVLIPGYMLSLGGYGSIWALFGSSNQLLSVLALSAAAVFLRRSGRKYKMMLLPMFFMLAVTLTALAQTVVKNFRTIAAKGPSLAPVMQNTLAILLIGLAIVVAVSCFKKIFSKQAEPIVG
ncbi:MAG: carbon starvation protein A [Sphaerochaetaceae bacterium]|nr:carbon starvation protein A [Spirochaetaceae bacterium]MDY6344830.1 carbon starvation protein A [Sphaerochaetaceae bacterium]